MTLPDTMKAMVCTRNITELYEESDTNKDKWGQLEDTARFDATLLPELWPELSAEERQSMLSYMEHFGLCCPLSRGSSGQASWLVPSLLPEPPAAHSFAGSQELIVRFIHSSTDWDDEAASGFLPNMLFFLLVSKMMAATVVAS